MEMPNQEQADTIAVFEIARIALDTSSVRRTIASDMDLSDNEMRRLYGWIREVLDVEQDAGDEDDEFPVYWIFTG